MAYILYAPDGSVKSISGTPSATQLKDPAVVAYKSGGGASAPRDVNLGTTAPSPYTTTQGNTILTNPATRNLSMGSTPVYQAPSAPVSTAPDAYTQFNTALMGLLKKQQSMGTAGFQQAGYNAQEAQNNTVLAPTSPDLVGAAPSTQDSVRSSAAGVYDPLVSGANNATQTFGQQINSLGDAINAAKSFGDSYESHQENMKSQAQDTISNAVKIGGAAGLESIQKANPNIFKVAGLDYESLLVGARAQEKAAAGTGTPGTMPTASVTALKAALNASKFSGAEADGTYADPNLYLQNYNSWIAQGGDAATFLKTFPPASYINPANTWLPPEILKFVKSTDLNAAIDAAFS